MKQDKTTSSETRQVYSTTDVFADSLGVTRQSLHGWRKADWWPISADPPWDELDRLEVLEVREQQTGGGENQNIHEEFKRSQILRNKAATLRIMRESAKELGQLADVEAVRRVLESSINGGAATLALQSCAWRVEDFIQGLAQSQFGQLLRTPSGINLDLELRAVMGNPIGEAVSGAMQDFIARGFGDNTTFGLIRQLQQLARDAGESLTVEEPEPITEVDELVNRLRLAVGDGETTRDQLINKSHVKLAHAAIDADARLAVVVAEAVAADEWETYLIERTKNKL
jgi:hypothetical protein